MIVASSERHSSPDGDPESPRLHPWAFAIVRPAWALSCGCKSRREEVIVIEADRNCGRVTDRGKEAASETAG